MVQYTLLVNGSMTQTFKPSKGLKQEDPIFSYLFLLCANVLSPAFLKAEHNKDIQGIKVCKNGCTFPTFSLLMTICSFSKKTTNPFKISKISCNGTVTCQGRRLIWPNQTFFAPPTFLKMSKLPYPILFRLTWS